MLQIDVPDREYFDDSKQEFIYYKKQTLFLEHSLISISKWESKWKKPFLETKDRTLEESTDYIRCMTLNTHVDPGAYIGLTQDIYEKVGQYINDTMTATWFNNKNQSGGNRHGGKAQVVTSELIYYWMIAYEIPFECQKWHLNRLLTLIRICEIKNQPSKKMSKKALLSGNRSLNESRKRALGTKG